jgi:protein-S-isoprenylcysteine O-methyltransferase Ste14
MLRKTIPPVYFFAALIIMVVLHHLLPLAQLIPAPVSYAGTFLVIAGFSISAWGAHSFKKADTPVKPFEKSTALITHGLYRYTRNPMYSGMMIILLGTWILLGSLSPLLVIPVFFLIIQEGFIKHEEPFLEGIFGDEYREYKSRVRRWL